MTWRLGKSTAAVALLLLIGLAAFQQLSSVVVEVNVLSGELRSTTRIAGVVIDSEIKSTVASRLLADRVPPDVSASWLTVRRRSILQLGHEPTIFAYGGVVHAATVAESYPFYDVRPQDAAAAIERILQMAARDQHPAATMEPGRVRVSSAIDPDHVEYFPQERN